MLCMCWDHQEIMDQNGEASGQCGTTGEARMAQEARVKELVLVHRGPDMSGRESDEKARVDIDKIYRGELVFSGELMSIPL